MGNSPLPINAASRLRFAVAVSVAIAGLPRDGVAQSPNFVAGRILVDTGFASDISGTLLNVPGYSDFFPERHLFRQVGSTEAPLTSGLGRIAVEAGRASGKGLEIEATSQAIPEWESATIVEANFEVVPVWQLTSPPPMPDFPVPVLLRITGSATIEADPQCQLDCASAVAGVRLSDRPRGVVVDERWELDTDSGLANTLDIDLLLEVELGLRSVSDVLLLTNVDADGGGSAEMLLTATLKIDPDASFIHDGVARRFQDAFLLRFSPEIAAIPIPEPSSLQLGAGLLALLLWRQLRVLEWGSGSVSRRHRFLQQG